MKEPFKAVEITDNIYWVGAIDWSLRDFHGYSTRRGTTYNAYLVLTEKITLIDTVKAQYKNELLARISSIINPKEIKYIISNHSEMDHSGCLPEIIKEVNPENIFASVMGVKALNTHFRDSDECKRVQAVKDGDSLSLGNYNIQFLETRMLHWPDSMVSYVPQKKLLFSQDGFGMHLASGERFADQIPDDIIEYEGAKYFANILLPYTSLIQKLIDRVTQMGLEFDLIAPDHGPVWRKDTNRIINLYARWAEQKPGKKAIITYDTMWKSTELMARSIADGITSEGIHVKLLPLNGFHRSDIVTELLDAGALILGSPTINNNMFPTVADLCYYIRGLKPKNLIGFVFGSYGWSGESITQIEDLLKGMNVELTGPGIKSKYVPDKDVLEECFARGVQTAKRLKEIYLQNK